MTAADATGRSNRYAFMVVIIIKNLKTKRENDVVDLISKR